MRTALAMAGVAVLLAGCGSSLTRLNPTPQGVSYVYEGDRIQQASEQATKHCAAQGRSAHLANVAKQDRQNVAIFTCN